MDSEVPMTKVYARLDNNNNVIAVNSSVFLQDTAGWTLIDDGYGDKYAHAQGDYLPGPVSTDDGIPCYRWDGEKVIERTAEDIAADKASLPPSPLTETALLKAQVEALTARGEFLEDVIAEMAMMVL